MSTGRPIITTMTLDSELYKYGIRKAGFNPTELAQANIEVLILKKEEYSALTNLARTYFVQQFSKDVIASQVEGLYSHLIKKS
jgi:glycosyltransferase involved in cell wall biosynthesis